jgi:hypothetical protein
MVIFKVVRYLYYLDTSVSYRALLDASHRAYNSEYYDIADWLRKLEK